MEKSIQIAIAPNRRLIENYLNRKIQKPDNPAHECLKRKDGSLYPLTSEQSGRVNTLIKKECCNYNAGNCVMLEYGDGCKCPQIASLHVCCTWFIEAVLPLDKVLKSSIIGIKDLKKQCVGCGKKFIPKNNKAKFCTKCAVKVHRAQQAEYNRKRRKQNRV